MKSYDETINTVFDRIHTYQVKKQKRTAITRRIAASCCAVSLLGGSVWYLNRNPNDTPINTVTDDNSHTTTGTTVTLKEKVLITVDPEDTITAPDSDTPDIDSDGFLESSDGRVTHPISPALKVKMEEYGNDDVTYAVVVQIFTPYTDTAHFDDISGFYETNEEMVALSEKLWKAYTAYVDAEPEDPTQKYSTTPAPEKLAEYYAVREAYVKRHTELYGNVDEIENEAIRSRVKKEIANLAYHDAKVEWRTFISTTKVITNEERLPHLNKLTNAREDFRAVASEWSNLHTQMLNEYLTTLRGERLAAVAAFCDTAPAEFVSDTLTGYYYYVELSADAINSLAESGYYSFRMASPDGSVEANWNKDMFSLDWE